MKGRYVFTRLNNEKEHSAVVNDANTTIIASVLFWCGGKTNDICGEYERYFVHHFSLGGYNLHL